MILFAILLVVTILAIIGFFVFAGKTQHEGKALGEQSQGRV